jgi:hypothetical protein
MKRIALIIIVALFSTQANAGFLLGYVVGSSSKNTNQPQVTDLGIPFFCLDEKTFDDYKKCRSPSALKIEWVKMEVRNDFKSYYMTVDDFIIREWNAMQKLKIEATNDKR